MKDSLSLGWIVGWTMGAVFGWWYWTETSTYQAGMKGSEIISECEKNLPRNLICELVAKPKEIK